MTDRPVGHWSWSQVDVDNLGQWDHVEVPLDVERAVTLTATVSANLPQSETYEAESVWKKYHERILNWKIEDTLDGHRWFTVGQGGLTRTQPQQILRFASPLGTLIRLSWWAVMVIGEVRNDTGSTQNRNFCNGAGCRFDHESLRVSDVQVDIVVRSI